MLQHTVREHIVRKGTVARKAHWRYLNEEIVGLVLDFACPNLLDV